MYVDASALVCILADEPERRDFVRKIEVAECFTSVVSVFEATLAVRELTGSCASALTEVMRLVREARIEVVAIEEDVLVELVVARDRYGKGSGHPARLNMGDCFSYAIAKSKGVQLLYKGNDFAQTDLA
ncbi:MAG: type II toxin-antitoxin system VapC family toxin [Rhizobiaceae bacterium]